ncbi:uncharacterized protein LOC118757350 [Rhagoletis pomonella]|uniref:uncharacterized protein LOC118757350 n=1 Tax=Rhagoletis pomonella TaxID=28610 RepID=UPI0017836A4B|nr:uncharacterized protein LOC118757350 [Rhagoletis pomonella]
MLAPLVVSLPSPSPSTTALPSPSSSITELLSPPPSSVELPTYSNARSAKKTNIEKLMQMYDEFSKCYKEAAAENIKMGEEITKVEKEKLEVLKKMRDNNKKLTEGVLDFLSRLN